MCNDYAREIEIGRVAALLKEMKTAPPFEYEAQQIPNTPPQAHIKISDTGFIVRSRDAKLIGSMTKWAWKEGRGPVFNFRSEKRDFSNSDRCLILATGFYEYTTPANPAEKLKDQHFFTFAGHQWFWILGIVKHDAFAMLTTAPGGDIKPYHNRQIVVAPPEAGLRWLSSPPDHRLLTSQPSGRLRVETLRRDGRPVWRERAPYQNYGRGTARKARYKGA